MSKENKEFLKYFVGSFVVTTVVLYGLSYLKHR